MPGRTPIPARWPVIIAFIAAIQLGARSSPAAVVVDAGLEQMVEASQVIATGTILKQETRPNAAQSGLRTFYDFELDAVVKGSLSTGEVLPLKFPGGEMDGLVAYAPGVPKFGAGESVLLFLDRLRDGTYAPVGWEMGVYRISVDPGTGAKIARHGELSPGVAVAGRAEGSPLPSTIDLFTFVDRIKEVMAADHAGRKKGEVR